MQLHQNASPCDRYSIMRMLSASINVLTGVIDIFLYNLARLFHTTGRLHNPVGLKGR